MTLQHVGYVGLPPHAKTGRFDHATVHHESGRLYVAHNCE